MTRLQITERVRSSDVPRTNLGAEVARASLLLEGSSKAIKYGTGFRQASSVEASGSLAIRGSSDGSGLFDYGPSVTAEF